MPGAAPQQAPVPCGPGEDRAFLPAHAAHAAHGLRAGLPQRESGLHRRVLGHAERARLRAAPRATGSPPPPQSPQETVAAPRPGAPPGQRRARVEGGPRPRPLKGLRSRPLTPACSACLTKEPSLDRPDRNLGRRPRAACLPPPAPGPVTSSISRLPRLSVSLSQPGRSLTTPHDCASKPASINGKQSAWLRAWSCGNARGCASACVVGHLPGKSGPAPSFSSRQGPQAEPLPLPSVKGLHSQGYLDRCFCLEVAGRVWRGNQPGCAGRPSPVRLCGRGWGDRRASSAEACRLNSLPARLPWAVPDGTLPLPLPGA